MAREPLDKNDIEALAKAAIFNLPEDRFQLQADTMNNIFQMLDGVGDVELGETSPAMAYHARWEEKS